MSQAQPMCCPFNTASLPEVAQTFQSFLDKLVIPNTVAPEKVLEHGRIIHTFSSFSYTCHLFGCIVAGLNFVGGGGVVVVNEGWRNGWKQEGMRR